MIGINLSGAEFGGSGTRYGVDYQYPTAQELSYYASRGVDTVRLPFSWERMQPTLGGSLSSTELSRMKTFLADANAQGIKVIIDLHNYGRYKGQTIGSSSVPSSKFADFWSKLASELKGSPALLGYDIMNEPHDMGGSTVWKTAAQAAVDAIRKVDMNTTLFIEGDGWSGAHSWQVFNSNLIINDPANKLYYQAHQYFDKNNSGTYANSYDADGTYADIGVDRLKPFVEWLQAHNLKGFMGEFGAPSNDSRWLEVMSRFMKALDANGISGTAWGGGFMWSDTYKLRLGGGSSGDTSGFNLIKGFINESSVISGTSGADTLNGTSNADRMRGGDGNDVLMGSLGSDSLSGGSGSDMANYANSTAAVNVDLNRACQVGGYAAGDILGSIEQVAGSSYADTLKGNSGANTLIGNAGDDFIIGLGGADRIDGGSGIDTADYSASTAGIDIDFLRSTQMGGDAQGDVLTSIEKVVGSAYSDKFSGSANADSFIGGSGNDSFVGRGGADTLDGGLGRDTADYRASAAGVDIDLTRTSQIGGDAAGDVLKGIEDLLGSAYNDRLFGDANANLLSGGSGADVLNGRGGSDQLTGGAGNDRFIFDSAANAKGDKITDFQSGDIIDFGAMDANSKASGDQAFAFIGSKSFSGSAGQLRMFQDSGHNVTYIQGDINGDKVADFTVALSGLHLISSQGLIL